MSDEKEMPLLEHLYELRVRLLRATIALLIGTVIGFFFARPLLRLLIKPTGGISLQALSPTESIAVFMRVALIAGITIAMPAVLYQALRYILPGLTPVERRALFWVLPGATFLFIVGALFAYLVMLPAAIPFLQGFMADIIQPGWAANTYISFVTALIFWVGLSFETPLIFFFLAKVGIVDHRKLAQWRKYAVLLIAILAAAITPTPDPFNMILVMAPLIVLYELSIVLARLA